MPPNTKSCCRPHKFGNPFKIGAENTVSSLRQHYIEKNGEDKYVDAEDVVLAYRTRLEGACWLFQFTIWDELHGYDLACFCALDQPCHVDVILEYANLKNPYKMADGTPINPEIEINSKEWLKIYRAHDFQRINVNDNVNLEYRIDNSKFDHLGVKRVPNPDYPDGDSTKQHIFYRIGTDEQWEKYGEHVKAGAKSLLS